MKLTGKQVEDFCIALQNAYGNKDELRMMLRYEMEVELGTIAEGNTFSILVFNLVAWAEQTGRIKELLASAAKHRPLNPDLQQFILRWQSLQAESEPSTESNANEIDNVGRQDSVDEESRSFSASICDFMAEIHRDIHELTQEQYVIIRYLRYVNRVRISGCAGSGKTLVAAEKACRLARAGLRVLFLCHNPLLAEYVQKLTLGTGVSVADFCYWVAEFSGSRSSDESGIWSHYDEPSEHDLANALDKLTDKGGLYDAVVVDEAQDFRSEWWLVVESALLNTPNSSFYIFHDNNQTLLSRRGDYPINEPVLDLSKNCRNCGRIYELMRFFDSSAPDPELRLRDRGALHAFRYEVGSELKHVENAVQRLFLAGLFQDTALLIGTNERLDNSFLAGITLEVRVASRWQDEVAKQFRSALFRYDARGVLPPNRKEDYVLEALQRLSDAPYPTDEDVQIIVSLAKSFRIESKIRRRILDARIYAGSWRWVSNNYELRLRRHTSGPIWSAEPLLFFQSPFWHEGIPKPVLVSVQPYHVPRVGRILPLYKVEDFKGLEADTVILLLRGKVQNNKELVYVGISRARLALIILADEVASSSLPRSLTWSNINDWDLE